LPEIDHLIYAAPSLEAGIDAIETRLGARAVAGGRHPAWGTHNALLALGPDVYLEILAPEPGTRPPPRLVDFARSDLPRLVTWAARDHDLDALTARARRSGLELGTVHAGGRRAPDGAMLEWRLTDPATPRESGLVPFLIDWGATPHPAARAPRAGELVRLRAEHPEPDAVRRELAALAIDLTVDRAPEPALIAEIRTARGIVEIR
jgi:hypothetical protein